MVNGRDTSVVSSAGHRDTTGDVDLSQPQPGAEHGEGLRSTRSEATELLGEEQDRRQPSASKTKENLRIAWNGFALLASKLERALDGTPVKPAVATLNALIDISQAVTDNDEAVGSMLTQLNQRAAILDAACERTESSDVKDRLTSIKKILGEQASNLQRFKEKKRWTQVLESSHDATEIQAVLRFIDESLKTFQLQLLMQIEHNTGNSNELLERPPLVNWPRSWQAQYNAYVDSATLPRQACTPGTRVAILDRIISWANDHLADSPRVFWLTGLAGTGKSAIAYSVCEHFDNPANQNAGTILGASFFCSRQIESTRDPKYIIPTIACQLARSSSSSLADALRQSNPDSVHSLAKQMMDLFVVPWRVSSSRINQNSTSQLVVVDALEENDGGANFLQQALDAIAELQGLKFLITSRPTAQIRSLCSSFSQDVVCRLHETDVEDVTSDVLIYLRSILPHLENDPEIVELSTRAGGLFAYASTAARILLPHGVTLSPAEQRFQTRELLKKWPSYEDVGQLSLLDEMYRQIIVTALGPLSRNIQRIRLDILHTVICSQERLSIAVLSKLLGFEEEIVRHTVNSFHSVIYESREDGRLYWYHCSFVDFIFDAARAYITTSISSPDINSGTALARETSAFCDRSAHHARLATRCFDVMAELLSFNVCGLHSSFILDVDVEDLEYRVREHIEPVLRYACTYWANHLMPVQTDSPDAVVVLEHLQLFVENQLLFWIEAVNITNHSLTPRRDMRGLSPHNLKLSEAAGSSINSAKIRCDLILWNAQEWTRKNKFDSALSDYLLDAANFTMYFTGSPAVNSTPHLYLSALATWHDDSPVSECWRVRFSGFPVAYRHHGLTSSPLIAKIGLVASVHSIVISPDATRIAVVFFKEKHIEVWCTTNLEKLRELHGHGHWIRSASFAPHGSTLISGSYDASLRVWNLETGEQIHVLWGHSDGVEVVSYSPDGSLIISGSWDRSIRVWDSESRETIGILLGHAMVITSLAFSCNGKQIISGSNDGTMRVWDTDSGRMLKRFRDNHGGVNSVSFSSDGTCCVSGSNDGSVSVWELSTRKQLLTMSGHTGPIYSISFSSDEVYLISASGDGTIRVWNSHTAQELNVLYGHTSTVSSARFHPHSTRIISGSWDSSLRVWSAAIGTRKDSTQSLGPMYAAAYSPDGTCIASGTRNGLIHIWDASSGVAKAETRGHNAPVRTIAYSSDGRFIVSGSDDRTVRTWCSVTGTERNVLTGHSRPVRVVIFSSDCTRIASGSTNGTIRLWSASGKPVREFLGHTGCVNTVSFSVDGARIASGSDDLTVRIWDAATGDQLRKSKDFRDGIRAVSFSPDGHRLISCSDNGVIHTWDATTGDRLSKARSERGVRIKCIAFSPDGALIAAGCTDDTVRVRDVATGKLLRVLTGHIDTIGAVSFSPDGSRIMSASHDRSIRIWDYAKSDASWDIGPKGWIFSYSNDAPGVFIRLMWVCDEIRHSLRTPYTELIISSATSGTINFESSCIGTNWMNCYTP